MTRKWNVPLTYQPKIEPVSTGKCTQTIRIGNKYSVGDLIRFYTWSGKPYRSKRTTITEYAPIKFVRIITIINDGIIGCFFKEEAPMDPEIYARCTLWIWEDIDWLASLDGIVPPTGEALRDVLMEKNGSIPEEGVEAQIIRWKP
jgi:hypothetical protein